MARKFILPLFTDTKRHYAIIRQKRKNNVKNTFKIIFETLL